MHTIKLSSKGQVTIPKILRDRHRWNAGQQLAVIDTAEGVLLRPFRAFQPTKLEQVAGILKYSGKPVSVETMEEAIEQGALERKG